MADREAKLKLIAELEAKGATAAAAALRKELDGLAPTTAAASQGLADTAAATDAVGSATAKTVAETDHLASSLKDAGQAATETGQKTTQAAQQGVGAAGQVVAATEDQERATREAGQAAVESGRKTEDAAEGAASAVDRLTKEWRETIDAAKDAGVSLDLSAAIGSIDEFAGKVRGSGDDLEKQRAALEGLAQGLQEDFDSLTKGAESSGDTSTEKAKLVEQAMGRVRAQIAEVDAAMRKVGPAAETGGGQAGAVVIDLTRQLGLATTAADDAQKKLTDTGRLPKAEIRNLSELIEGARIAMEQLATAGQTATPEQIKRIKELEDRLAGLNVVTNRQIDASQDNSVALKDEAQQVQALAASLGGLIGVTGNAGTAMSSFAAKGTGAFVAYDNAKNAIRAMNLNTLQLSTSTAAGKTQIGLMIAALIASAAAGFKAASANRDNADSVGKVVDAVKNLKDNALNGLSDRWDGAQASAQRMVEVLLDLESAIGTVIYQANGGDKEITISNLDKFAHTLKEIALGAGRGRDAIDVYNQALRAGVPEQQAFNIAIADSAKVQKFATDARIAGVQGDRLWREGLQAAQGDVKKLEEYIRNHTAEMYRAVAANKDLAAAQAEQHKSAQALRGVLDALDLVLGSEKSASQAMKLRVLAEALTKTAEEAKHLSSAERDRLRIIGDLLARGEDLNAQQKAFAGILINQARAGKEASEVLNRLAQLVLEFEAATNGSTKSLDAQRAVLAELNAHHDINSQKIRRVISDMQEQLDATDNLTEAQRASMQEQIDYLNAVESERDRIASLAAERTARYARDTVDQENRVREAIRLRLEDLRQIIPVSGSYGDEMAALSSEIRELMGATTGLSAAERERLEMIAELASKGSELSAVEREWVTQLVAQAAAGQAATKSMNDLAEAQLKLASVTEGITLATNGSTAAINLHLDAILKAIGAGEQHSVMLGKLAESLRAELTATDGLTNAQRAQIEAVADLAERSEELTNAEKRQVAALVEAVQAGNERLVNLKNLATAEDDRTTKIQSQIEAIREQIAIQERALGLDKKQVDVNAAWGGSLDYLRMKEEQLQRELEQGLYVVQSSTAAKQGELDISIERIAKLNDEAQAHDKVKASQDAVIQVVKDGRIEYTNLAAAQDASKQKGIELVETNGKLKKSADDAAETMRHLGTAFDGTTITIDTFMGRAKQLIGVVDEVNKKLRELDKAAQTVAGG